MLALEIVQWHVTHHRCHKRQPNNVDGHSGAYMERSFVQVRHTVGTNFYSTRSRFFGVDQRALPKIVPSSDVYGKVEIGPLKGIPIAGVNAFFTLSFYCTILSVPWRSASGAGGTTLFRSGPSKEYASHLFTQVHSLSDTDTALDVLCCLIRAVNQFYRKPGF